MRSRLRLIAMAMTLSSVGAHAQERSCSDFSIGANQQIAACNAVISGFTDNSNATVQIRRADTVRYNLFLNRGAAYARIGNLEQSKADFKRAVDMTTEALEEGGKPLPDEYNRSCWSRAVANVELDRALADCNESLRLRPGAPYVLDSRAFLYLRLGRPDDALKDYNEVLRITPKVANSLYGRGLAKLRLGDVEGAKADLFQAESLTHGTRTRFTALGFAD
jgi:tetratricopeptide (TPR) repeat protein